MKERRPLERPEDTERLKQYLEAFGWGRDKAKEILGTDKTFRLWIAGEKDVDPKRLRFCELVTHMLRHIGDAHDATRDQPSDMTGDEFTLIVYGLGWDVKDSTLYQKDDPSFAYLSGMHGAEVKRMAYDSIPVSRGVCDLLRPFWPLLPPKAQAHAREKLGRRRRLRQTPSRAHAEAT